MSPRWRTTWITALAVLLLLLVAALVIWFLRTHERVNEQLPLPAYGEAAYNPLYALRQALRTDGLSAESRRRLDLDAMQLQPGDSVLLLDDPRLLGARERQRLLDWTASGGHLLLRVVAAEGEDDHGDADALLTTLGVQLSDEAPRCQFWQVSGDGEHSEFCNGPRFTLDAAADPELQWPVGSNDGLGYARLRYGQGRVDVLSDMDFLLNRGDELRGAGLRRLLANDHSGGLRDIAHRDLARQVLAPNYGQGTVHLVYSAQLPSFWLGVLRQAWPLWLPLLLALLAWLWMRSQRFGALLPSPREERRSLLEHVQASGQYLYRYGHSPLLYDAVHASFLARLRRRAPMAAALDDDARVQAIADHLQWPLARVQQALQAPAGNDRAGLRDRIRLLIQMRNQL